MMLTATNSTTPTLQSSLSRVQLEQAKRDVHTAQDRVQTLQKQTDQAKAQEQNEQRKVRSLSERVFQEDATYSRQLRGPRSAIPASTKEFLLRMYAATSSNLATSGNPLISSTQAQPFVNALGQRMGYIVDLNA